MNKLTEEEYKTLAGIAGYGLRGNPRLDLILSYNSSFNDYETTFNDFLKTYRPDQEGKESQYLKILEKLNAKDKYELKLYIATIIPDVNYLPLDYVVWIMHPDNRPTVLRRIIAVKESES